MENSIIFVLCLYIIVTNPFIKVRIYPDGIYIITRKKEFRIVDSKYEEVLSISLKKIIRFKNKKPF